MTGQEPAAPFHSDRHQGTVQKGCEDIMTHFPCKAAKVFFLSAFSALLMAGFASADEEIAVGVGLTTGSSLRMREAPTTDSSVVYTLNKNCALSILDTSEEDWYRVAYNGKIGYVSAEYLREIGGEEDFKAYARVSGEGVYVREAPSDASDVLNVIDNKAMVTVTDFEEGWYAVKCQYGTEGYIRSDFLDLTTPETSSSDSGKASGIVALARKYVGVRYVYGGASPRGFDCSGFTMYLYKQYGYKLEHTASWQFNYGPGYKVSKSDLKPGDLVFFRDPKRAKGKACSHCGMYIGNGQFIHASSSGGVKISNLSASYYSTYYKGARRIMG